MSLGASEQQANMFKAAFASMSVFSCDNENDQMSLFFIFLLAGTVYHVFAQSTFFFKWLKLKSDKLSLGSKNWNKHSGLLSTCYFV